MDEELEQPLPRRPSLVERRASGQNLDRLHIPPYDDSVPVTMCMSPIFGEGDSPISDEAKEVVEEGQELFQNFVYEQIEQEATVDISSANLVRSPYKNPVWAKTSRDLRLMADQFARTEERRRVQERAEEVDFDVTFDQFQDLLRQLFADGGITSERIVVLFYFCSDVAICALRAGKDLFLKFLNWSLSFIARYVCMLVYRHGGWGQVMRSPFNSFTKLCFWATATVALIIMIKYFRSKSI